VKEKLKILSNSFIIAGVIILLIGFYFSMIKAGIPYQDPTTEMTIRWTAYYYAGTTCLQYGGIAFLVGVIGRVVCIFIRRTK